jgi:cytoskeletal protein CcmA (bactofilin family)
MPLKFWKAGHGHEPVEFPDDWVGWLEPGIEVEGKIKIASGLLRLNSHFKGEIHSQGTVVVHDQGEVEGEIHATIVSVTGKVKGTIHASERVEIKEHAIVLADLYTAGLVVDPGGFFDGQCHMPARESTGQTTKVDTKDHS